LDGSASYVVSAFCKFPNIADGDAPFWVAPDAVEAEALSLTVCAKVASPAEIALWLADSEVEELTWSNKALLASRVIEATSAPPYGLSTILAISREYPGVLALVMLRAIAADCAAFTTNEELMMLYAEDKLMTESRLSSD
jgi:hypothetical protein